MALAWIHVGALLFASYYYLIKGSFGFSRMHDTTLMELQSRNSLHEMSALPG